MAAPNKKFRLWSAVLVPVLLGAAAVIAACSSNNSNPSPPVFGIEGGADTGTDATHPPAQDGSTPSDDAPSEAAVHDAGPPEDAFACTTDSGCWSCTPQTTPEFLNQCTVSACSPFNNAQRLPNYDGSLPPLQ